MKDKEKVKETIINATTELIEQSGGEVKNITARAIADKSGVALGLINYHFESKEKLIAICVQRIINKVLMSLAPDKKDYSTDDGLTDKQRLTSFAQQTFDFLFDNYAIIKISILSDFRDYQPVCNSVYTQIGFRYAIRGKMSENKKQLIAFSLVSIMQTVFLTGENSKQIIGYNLFDKTERDLFISYTVSMLMEGINE